MYNILMSQIQHFHNLILEDHLLIKIFANFVCVVCHLDWTLHDIQCIEIALDISQVNSNDRGKNYFKTSLNLTSCPVSLKLVIIQNMPSLLISIKHSCSHVSGFDCCRPSFCQWNFKDEASLLTSWLQKPQNTSHTYMVYCSHVIDMKTEIWNIHVYRKVDVLSFKSHVLHIFN